jgi:hypothetical protein
VKTQPPKYTRIRVELPECPACHSRNVKQTRSIGEIQAGVRGRYMNCRDCRWTFTLYVETCSPETIQKLDQPQLPAGILTA